MSTFDRYFPVLILQCCVTSSVWWHRSSGQNATFDRYFPVLVLPCLNAIYKANRQDE
jgi:hypothetical protein